MKLKINSNFKDYYDIFFVPHWDIADGIYQRYTKGNKLEEFRTLKELSEELNGIVIPYGKIKELSSEYVVEYTDITEHCGEGKKLVKRDPSSTNLGSEYIPHECTYRHLQIDNLAFIIKYSSLTDWKSNGENSIEEFISTTSPMNGTKDPLFAVDYIAMNNKKYLIDYNRSPGIKVLQPIISGEIIYSKICNWTERNKNE